MLIVAKVVYCDYHSQNIVESTHTAHNAYSHMYPTFGRRKCEKSQFYSRKNIYFVILKKKCSCTKVQRYRRMQRVGEDTMSSLCFGCQYKVHSLPDTVLLRHIGKHISSLSGYLLDDSNQGIKGRHTEGKETYIFLFQFLSVFLLQWFFILEKAIPFSWFIVLVFGSFSLSLLFQKWPYYVLSEIQEPNVHIFLSDLSLAELIQDPELSTFCGRSPSWKCKSESLQLGFLF